MHINKYIEEAENLLEEDETILKEIIFQGKYKTLSAYIFLTNKRVIYWKYVIFGKRFRNIYLPEIRGIRLAPQQFSSSGVLVVATKQGKEICLSPSLIGQSEADEFISAVKKEIQ